MRHFVAAGERRVGRSEGTFSVLGLGSCVVIALYDGSSQVGGMAHVLLPDPSYNESPARLWRYATSAIPALIEETIAAGARRGRLSARLVGGACMFRDLLPRDQPNIGERNVAAARLTLAQAGIRVIGEDVGGEFGRSVFFRLSDGRVRVQAHGREHVEI
ncbi:MAG: chemotaxis protein CheD [Gemmatimonadetes bacterium]|uniref:Probable chemoreceptor glutamine deamidase CheD n=1 Tax=Candidatus Kutchimonas denitrificans TaxID=3056748 RepID=A0AAE5CCR0_9BACT|nr:chemotaxis protein CheD [Gemmatimonadota bacterium]NIR74534.1 chemotaxis protein CheD [Candidatus Kutchimonas denitrificans]NIS02724.1 chemotaxis protein CheD [Gemmatimonadota bacterium]NIT68885.1 chemotaxis protein CheD [Gemmatimonadota bacterium]NIU52190.1 chemotaxis protein CheD [Gemmatimonadota bacterium]